MRRTLLGSVCIALLISGCSGGKPAATTTHTTPATTTPAATATTTAGAVGVAKSACEKSAAATGARVQAGKVTQDDLMKTFNACTTPDKLAAAVKEFPGLYPSTQLDAATFAANTCRTVPPLKVTKLCKTIASVKVPTATPTATTTTKSGL